MRGLKTVALLAGLFVCVSAAAVRAHQPPSPAVVLSVTLPDGQVKQLDTYESGLVTVTVSNREYGFRPTMHDDAGTRMTITVFDMGGNTEGVREVGSVEVKGGGPSVSTRTSPAFKVQARKAAGTQAT
ncbi:MAG: hypothetical protein AB7H96_02100 [Vicinamibacterales bacterium]